MKRWTCVAFAVALLSWIALSGSALSQKEDDKPDVKDFMRGKLIHMQKVLEGITIEDYDLIRSNANQMALLSKATQWRVLQTDAYQQHSAEFRRSAEAVVEAAKKKNLDGAALAYVDMTMKCVTCHKYVRSVRMANLDLPTGPRLSVVDPPLLLPVIDD
jgi:hypothetical protein